MKEEIKELRLKLDSLAQLTRELKPLGQKWVNLTERGFVNVDKRSNSKEIEKAYDSLILAKAWLGKILGELGESTPYANDGQRKTVEDIEPTTDTSKLTEEQKILYASNNKALVKAILTQEDWDNFNHIEKVDWLREEIKNIIDTTTNFSEDFPEIELEQGFVYKYLCEARFWLGWELARLRDEKTER